MLKKKTTKALAALLLASVLLVSCNTGSGTSSTTGGTESSSSASSATEGSTNSESSSVGGSEIVPGEVVEITISMFDRGAIPASEGSYEDWEGTRLINEAMAEYGVKINWLSVPRNESRAKLNALIASGSAPEVLWEYSRSWMAQLKAQESIIPMDHAIETYSTSYKEYYKENHDLIAPYVELDGATYAAASLRDIAGILAAGTNYRVDWLEELGIAEPQSMDELIEAARAMKTLGDDIIPIAGSTHWINVLQADYGFRGGPDSEVLDEATNRLIPSFQSTNYFDAMTTAKLMYEEGLIDPEYVVDKNFDRQKQLWSSGRSGFYMSSAFTAAAETQAIIDGEPDAIIKPLAPLETKYGRFLQAPQSATNMYIMFSSHISENQQHAAMKYFDWLLDGGWKPVVAGVEGVNYTENNGVRTRIAENGAWPGAEYALFNRDQYFKDKYALSTTPDREQYKSLNEGNDLAIQLQFAYPSSLVVPFDCSDETYSEFITNWMPIYDEIQTRIITDSSLTVEAGVAEMQKQFEILGGVEAWEIKNTWYEENQELFASFNTGFDSWINTQLENIGY